MKFKKRKQMAELKKLIKTLALERESYSTSIIQLFDRHKTK